MTQSAFGKEFVMNIKGWAGLITAVKTPFNILVLIILIVGTILFKTFGQNPLFDAFMILILVSAPLYGIYLNARQKALMPDEIRSIWSKNDLPLNIQLAEAWLQKWNCRWSFQSKNNDLKPYVDDIIEIEHVDQETGELIGKGYSSYHKDVFYKLHGRISNKGVAHIFYTSPKESAGLSGMIILNRPPLGNMTGWWIGAGRKGGDIGGGVIMEKHENNPDFVIQNYEVD